MAWSGEFREAPEMLVASEVQDVRELYDGKDVRALVLVQGDPVGDDFGGPGDSIFLSEIEQVKPGEAVYLVDGQMLLNDCLFDVEVS